MKFSKKPRTTFEVSQYNPGPGYYTNQDKIDQEVAKVQNNPSFQQTFARQDRFNDIIDEEKHKIGPGSYKLGKSDFDKFNQTKNSGRGNLEKSHDQQAQYVRINAVPSIPSKNVKEGYQEIGEGLLIVMKNQQENEHAGPGQYTPNYNFVKPRTMKAYIKNEMKQRQASSDNLENKQRGLFNNAQQVDASSTLEQNLVGLVPKDHSVQNTISENVNAYIRPESDQRIRQPQGQRFRSELTCLVSRDPKKRQIGEYNLELLMIRERQLAKDEKAPPPGKYYNQNLHTSFKVSHKLPDYQCFDSSVQRFEENGVFKNKVGPGQYNVSNISALSGVVQQGAVKFGKQKRSTSDYEHTLKGEQPGPGVYELKAQEIGNLERYDLYKLKQANLKFNSVFGSGSRRFTDQRPQSDSQPGPGSYTVAENKKVKKRKRVKTLYMQSNSETALLPIQNNNVSLNKDLSFLGERVKLNIQQGQSNNISYNDQNTTNYTRIVEVDDTFDIRKMPDVKPQANNTNNNQNSYVFKSQANRFRNNNQSFDHNHNLDGADKLGPGCYQITQEIHKQKHTHNKGQDLMNRSPRVTDRKEGIQIPKLGPGYYDPSVLIVKPKQACLTKI